MVGYHAVRLCLATVPKRTPNPDVTVTGPLGFQVSVVGPYLHDARLIGDFGSLQEAEAFADRMREIDAGPSHVSPMPQHREMDDPRSDDLIDHNHVLIAAATKA
jgi:hypothetical protein